MKPSSSDAKETRLPVQADVLRKLQHTELNILHTFIEICEKKNFRYFILGGTLIGAVRHKGFIPWDDDIDVGMPRADYEKFLQQGPALLPKKYFLQSYHSEAHSPWPFAKLRDTTTIYKEREVSNLPVQQGVWIDVFPIDWCNLKTYWLIATIQRMLANRVGTRFVGSKRLARRILGLFSPLLCPSWHKAVAWQDKLGQLRKRDTGYMGNLFGRYGRKEIVPTSWFDQPAYLEFEGLKVAAPKEYHQYLTQIYGDYMKLPPKEKQVSLHATTEIKFNINNEVKL